MILWLSASANFCDDGPRLLPKAGHFKIDLLERVSVNNEAMLICVQKFKIKVIDFVVCDFVELI
jgi:hypothetical protein